MNRRSDPGSRFRRQAGRAVAIGAATATLLVAACTPDGPEPEPSPTASAPPDKPEFPPEALERTEEGLEAFGDYYYALADYSRRTGDFDDLKGASTSNCTGCADFWAPSPQRFDHDLPIYIERQRSQVLPSEHTYDGVLRIWVSTDPEMDPLRYELDLAYGDILDLVFTEDGWKADYLDFVDFGPDE